MNKVIKKIAMDCDVYCDQHYPNSPHYDILWEQKFAELIVKECANIAKHHVMNISTYADAEFVYQQIQEHFEVEE